jgi:hypothetical protein
VQTGPVELVAGAEQAAQPSGHYFKTFGVTVVSLYQPGKIFVHLATSAAVQAPHPAGQAVTADESKKNPSKTLSQSEKLVPKHTPQFCKQALIAETSLLLAVKVKPVPSLKYLPHPSTGVQSIKELFDAQVQRSVW